MLILIADSFSPSLPKALRPFGEVTQDMGRLEEAQVLLVRSKTKCTREFLAKAPRLRLILRGGVGLDNVDLQAAKETHIEVRNTPKASGIAVAELAFSFMLGVSTRILEGHLSMTEGKWSKKELKRSELWGKSLGLLGLGNIATAVATRAKAFGMNVLGYDAFKKSHPIAKILSSPEELYAQSDYISLHVPLTPESRGIISHKALETMKEGAVLINTARADVVNPQAVKDALEKGRLGWYCTDVWPQDPPEKDYPLLGAPRVLMAPHIGANTKENMERIGEEIVTILKDFTKEV